MCGCAYAYIKHATCTLTAMLFNQSNVERPISAVHNMAPSS